MPQWHIPIVSRGPGVIAQGVEVMDPSMGIMGALGAW